MSLLNKLKKEAKRVNDVEAQRSSGFQKFFKPDVGDNMIRILPHWDKNKRDEEFYVRRLLHYLPVVGNDGNDHNSAFRCLKDREEKCPACIAYARLKKDKNNKKADALRPSERYIYNVIDYGNTEREPSVIAYMAPFSIHKELMNFVDEYGTEFWSIDNGRDWKLKKAVDKSKGAKFGTSYKMYPKMADSAVPKKLLALLKEMTNLDELYAEFDVKAMLASMKKLGVTSQEEESEESDEEEDEEEDEKSTKKSVKKKKPEPEEDDEEDEEEEEEEEEEEKPAAKKKKPEPEPVKKKKKPEPEPEEDEDEEEDEEEEEEPAAKKKKKFTRSAKSADDELEDDLKRLGI